MAISSQQYQVQPGETIDQYNQRIASLRSGQIASGPTQNVAASYDPTAAQSQNRSLAGNVANSTPTQDPNDIFNQAVTNMLVQAQQLGTKPLAQQGFNAQDAQSNAILNPNLNGLQGASPSQQQSVINSQANTFNPVISGSQQGAQTFGEQIKSFGDIVNTVSNYQQQAQQLAETKFKDLVTNFGGEGLQNWAIQNPQQAAQLERTLGYGKGSLVKLGQTLKDKEQQLKAQQDSITNYYKALAQGVTPVGPTPVGVTPGTNQEPTQVATPIDASSPDYTTKLLPGVGLTQSALDLAALNYLTTGQMPSLGLGSSAQTKAQRAAIINRAGQLGSGGNIAANKASLQANAASLKQQTEYLNNTQRAISTADANFQLLVNTAQKAGINDQSSPIINQLQNAISRNIIGNGDLNQFYTGIQTLRTEYATVLARGGQVTDSVRSEANQLIPDNISLANLNKVYQYIKQEGGNVVSGAQAQVQSIQNSINGIVGGNASGSTDQSSSQTIRVKRNSDGITGTIPQSEFDPNLYTKI